MRAPSWRDARAEAARRLAAAGVETADVEARYLVEEVTGSTADEWPELAGLLPSERAAARLDGLCDRRCSGEPLQYVLGRWQFRNLDLMVDRRVLIPRPETEWVVEVALEEAVRLGLRRGRPRRFALRASPGRAAVPRAVVADLGTGSGAIALSLEAELPDAEVWAVDADAGALAVAQANAAGCGATRLRTGLGSWYDALPRELRGRVRLIVSNPPYVAEAELASLPGVVADHEPRAALVAGADGLDALRAVVGGAPGWLGPPGALVCEIAPHQADAVVELARGAGFAEAFVRDDLTGRPRVLVARDR